MAKQRLCWKTPTARGSRRVANSRIGRRAGRGARSLRFVLAAALSMATASPAIAQDERAEGPPARTVLEGYPTRILNSMAVEQRSRRSLSKRMNVPFALLVPVSRRWVPGQVVRVAFVAGTPQLHAQIEAAARAWVDATTGGNLQLSFRNQDRTFRQWSATDTQHQAEIRIAFVTDDPHNDGYWSHVGRDSINSALIGGRPGDASMNLDGFDQSLPREWRETVLHEFGHALGFEHEHQSPLAQCGFKFNDDRDYVPTTDRDGVFVRDSEGRNPGLYTYLTGPPNGWEISQVDANLKQIAITDEFFSTGAFDNQSIMRYWFPAFFFENGPQSPCYSEGENEQLSEQDLAAARIVYPRNPSRELMVGRQILHQLPLTGSANSRLAETVRRTLKAEAQLQ